MSNHRILALDILRGITIAGMILVNNPGSWAHIYAPLSHAPWNGLTPTDLVFPFFMFIMGISTYISLRKLHFALTRDSVVKVLKRSLFIFLTGMAIGWFSRFCFYWHAAPEGLSFFEKLREASWTFDRIRILGVMQRLAICYCVASFVAMTLKFRQIVGLIVLLLVGYSVLLLTGNGYAYSEENILSIVDRAILTPTHMYRDNGIDPEGLLSTLPSIAHVLIGFCVGGVMLGDTSPAKGTDRARVLDSHIIKLFLIGTVLTFAGFLLAYGLPINKKIWSPTFVLTSCGLASSLLALLIWIIDVKGYRRWSRFFEAFGVNPLYLYVQGGVLAILFGAIRIPWDGASVNIITLIYGKTLLRILPPTAASCAYALLFVGLNWCVAYQLYKRRIYIKF
ncbi:heparan-alpha-glucosaminide N-acetyltransferase domain-containing protein [Alistipes sp.]|uniref:acyltransferase family protein n=1 Tax=Alistipes sp. TaxID=1872444 RepID=UPI0025B8B695|nr:heparan-alpha-glucosaminide N-acetyltransferase domain-containing protein [Alistipes sp.]